MQSLKKLEKPTGWLMRCSKPLTDLTVKAIGMYGGGVAKSIDMLANPQQPLLGSMDMAKTGLKVVNDVAAMALMPDDSPTLLKGQPNGKKVVAWSEPLSLDDVKTVGKALGCTINDVLLSCVAGAIGNYLHAQGARPGGQGDSRHGAGEPAPT